MRILLWGISPFSLFASIASAASLSPGLSLSLPGNVSTLTPDASFTLPLNATLTKPSQPFATTYGDLHIVLSDYGSAIPFEALTLLYVDIINDIWSAVAHRRPDTRNPPEQKPVAHQMYLYEEHGFEFVLRQAYSAVVAWEYGELFDLLTTLMGFAMKRGMWEMDIEVVARGTGNFEGYVKYDGRRRVGGSVA